MPCWSEKSGGGKDAESREHIMPDSVAPVIPALPW